MLVEKRAVNLTVPYSKRPIINRYQFISVPILMGTLVTLILLIISCIGVSALMNLQTPTKFESSNKK